VDPGLPLGFFDAQIRCGDALLGVFDLKVLEDGIPDAAYKPLTGDDKDTAKYYKKANQDATKGQGGFDFGTGQVAMPEMKPMALDFSGFRDLPEDTVKQIGAKAKRFKELRKKQGFVRATAAANLYVAAFLLPKVGGAPAGPSDRTVPTTEELWMALNQGKMRQTMVDAPRAARRARAFHWPLEFPDVMQRGGFDVVLGNPPWERIKLQEQEFFATRSPEIAGSKNASTRKKLIAALEHAPEGTPEHSLFSAFTMAKREAEATSEFVRLSEDDGGRFDLTGRGDVNTYALFAELFANLSRQRAGVIVPTGVATDATTAPFFAHLVSQKRLAQLVDFENSAPLFVGVHRSFKFSLLTLGHNEGTARFAFYITSPSQLAELERNFSLTPEQIARLNPNTRTASVFRTRADAEITTKMYENSTILLQEGLGAEGNIWGVKFSILFHMANDSHLFQTASSLAAEGYSRAGANWISSECEELPKRFLPLFEAKMFDIYDHRSASYESRGDDRGNRVLPDTQLQQHIDPNYEVQPFYWVSEPDVIAALNDYDLGAMLVFNKVTGIGNERSFIPTLMPIAGFGDSLNLMRSDQTAELYACLYANCASLCFDFVVRRKVGGVNINFFHVQQLPVLPPNFYSESRLAFITPKVLELTYTSHSLAPFARDLGHEGPPFVWDEDRRADLRADLDALGNLPCAEKQGRGKMRRIQDPPPRPRRLGPHGSGWRIHSDGYVR